MGRPLIDYTLQAAKKSNSIDDIFVSTDDANVLDVASQWKISTDYVRPDILATDEASVVDAVIHGLTWRTEQGLPMPTTLVLLQPTSPLRTARHIDDAMELFQHKNLNSLVGVTKMSEHPYKCVEKKENGWKFLAENSSGANNRQDYASNYFCINGALYIVNTEWFLQNKKWVVPSETYLFEMEREISVDIDTLQDFLFAETLMSQTPQPNKT